MLAADTTGDCAPVAASTAQDARFEVDHPVVGDAGDADLGVVGEPHDTAANHLRLLRNLLPGMKTVRKLPGSWRIDALSSWA